MCPGNESYVSAMHETTVYGGPGSSRRPANVPSVMLNRSTSSLLVHCLHVKLSLPVYRSETLKLLSER